MVSNPWQVVGFDVCETAQPTSGHYVNQKPPEQLIALLQAIKEHYLLMPITGQTQEVVQRLATKLDMLAFYLAAVEFGGQIINARRGTWMLSPESTAILYAAKTALMPFVRDNMGEPDPRDLSAFFSYWFHRGGDKRADKMVPRMEAFLDQQVPGWRDALEIKRWPGGEVLFKPRELTKQIAVDYLATNGYSLLVGAGDTPSDIPLIAAAQFGIVTHAEGGKADRSVIEAAKACPGGYYIAKSDQPHGYGLAAGLLAAREAGVLTF